jgi:hypothetical protein
MLLINEATSNLISLKADCIAGAKSHVRYHAQDLH